jgi:hypothetical protein
MEPAVGIEPTTYGLRNRCSTTELRWPLMDEGIGAKRNEASKFPGAAAAGAPNCRLPIRNRIDRFYPPTTAAQSLPPAQ